jgi:hypothetical protein
LGKTRGKGDGGFDQVAALLTKYEGAHSQKACRFIHGAGTISIKIKCIPKYRAGFEVNIHTFLYLGIRSFRLTARFFSPIIGC